MGKDGHLHNPIISMKRSHQIKEFKCDYISGKFRVRYLDGVWKK